MSGNVAGFVSFETPTQGFTRCDWGDRPVQVFPTALGSPYSFIWHKEDRPGGGSPPPGHTMIIGGTGSGKTVMLDFLGLSTLGYPDTYVFKTDRFAGSYIATKAAGGAYLELQSDDAMAGEPCQLNPLHIELSADPGHGPTGWVVNWLRDHVTGCDDIESERALGDAVRALAGLSKDKRNLTEIYRALPDNIPAKRELKRWVEGQYSYLFGGVDTLSLRDRRLVTFAFDRVLQDPVACRALLPYLSYRIEAAMEAIGAPFLFQIDETAAMLEDAGFRKWFVRLHDEVRKKRGVIVSCFQRVQSLAQAGVADTMLTSCPTQILLPNESATADDYCGVLGCTMVELEIVRGEHPTARMLGKRYALLRREGQGSVVLNTDLSVLGPHLNLFASGRSIASRFRQFEDSEGVTERAVAAYLASFGCAGRAPTAAAA
jgi:type IV secretion system protein VirB4